MAEDFNPNAWYVAGYEGEDGYWYDVEAGDAMPTVLDLSVGDELVIGYTDDDGVTHYWTMHGGFEDFDALAAAVHDLAEEYGFSE